MTAPTARAESLRNGALVPALLLAVPLHIHEITGNPPEWLLGEARRCADVVASHGDDLQFGGKHCARAFNAVARGLACAALVADGGATFLDLHWCRTPGCPGPGAHLNPSDGGDTP